MSKHNPYHINVVRNIGVQTVLEVPIPSAEMEIRGHSTKLWCIFPLRTHLFLHPMMNPLPHPNFLLPFAVIDLSIKKESSNVLLIYLRQVKCRFQLPEHTVENMEDIEKKTSKCSYSVSSADPSWSLTETGSNHLVNQDLSQS